MMKISKFRVAAIAALAMSVFQLNTASATTVWDQCDSEALGVLIGVCDYLTGGDWSSGEIYYTCSNGHLDQFAGSCSY
jgi:hypothetical protein